MSIVAGVVDSNSEQAHIYLIQRQLFARVTDSVQSRIRGQSRTVFDLGRAIADTLARIHDREAIDVIEMEESFGWAADVVKRIDIPVVVKLHGPAFLHLVEEDLRTPFGQEKVRREGVALSKMSFITSPSQCHLSDTLRYYSLRPKIGRHIVNPIAEKPDLPHWNIETCELRTILFVGRFDKVKGGDIILLAYQRLLREIPDLKLIFVGPDWGFVQSDDGRISLKEFVASMKDPAVEKGLQYCGPLAPAEIAALRIKAICTVIPSRRESQGYTALEAMLQGCPIVCADNSGLSEIVQHGVTGLKASTGDVECLAIQVKRIVGDHELAMSLGSAARRYVLRDHAPSEVVRKTLDMYCDAIDRS